jgi:type II secretory pathway pseudopilin PulG
MNVDRRGLRGSRWASAPITDRTPGRRLHSRALAVRKQLGHDDGTTLIELMVGMVLMSIFLAIFTGAVVMMNTAMNKSQAVNRSASQLDAAFHELDTLVRYAAAISTPGVGTSGNWYVEIRTTNSGLPVCSQLRVESTGQQLQRRTWEVGGASVSALSPWVPIASGIANGRAGSGPTSQPFYLVPVRATTILQQLTFNLAAQSGAGGAQSISTSSFTLTASNSVSPTPTPPICQEQGRP